MIRAIWFFAWGLVSANAVFAAEETALLDPKPLVPAPRSLVREAGTWAIPGRTTFSVSPDAESEVWLLREALTNRFPGVALVSAAAGSRADFRLTANAAEAKKDDESYRLRIGADGVDVCASTKAGVFYGLQTLANILSQADTRTLPCLSVEDAPGLGMRMAMLYMTRLQSAELPDVRRMLDLLAALKYNAVFFAMDGGFPYERLPLENRPSNVTKRELLELREYARSRHLEWVPYIQLLSHVNWLNLHPQYVELLENPNEAKNWGCNWCPSNPAIEPIWRAAVDELIDLYKPRYFHLALDEISAGSVGLCPRCRGKDQTELLRRAIAKYIRHIERRGVTPIVWQDSFRDPKHMDHFDPHVTGWKGWELLDVIPKNTLMNVWDYTLKPDRKSMARFAELGYSILGSPWEQHFGNIPLIAKAMHDLGGRSCGAFLCNWFYGSEPPTGGLESYSYRFWAGLALGAECFWNPERHGQDLETIRFDPVAYVWRRLHPQAAAKPVSWRPVSIASGLNMELAPAWEFPTFSAERLAEVKRDYAALPERFSLESENGVLRAIAVSGAPDGMPDGLPSAIATVALNGLKAKRLSLLATILPTAQFELDQNEWTALPCQGRMPVGKVVLRRADGSEDSVELRRAVNIASWNAPYLGTGGRFAARHHDIQGRMVQFSILELANDRSDVPLESLTLVGGGFKNRGVALLAVSAAGGAEVPLAAGAAPTKPLARGVQVSDERSGRRQYVSDAEIAVRALSGENLSASATSRLVASPWEPGKKAVEMTVCADRAPFGRICCDIPLSVPTWARGFKFKVRLTHSESLREAAYYLMRDGANMVARSTVDNEEREYSVVAAHDAMFVEAGSLKATEAKQMRVSFRLFSNHPVTITFTIPQWLEHPPVNPGWRCHPGDEGGRTECGD